MAKNPRLIDISGQRFGKWFVLFQSGNTKGGGAMWMCRCDCGTERPVLGADLRSGKSRECGKAGAVKMGALRRRHGETGTRIYRIWQNMRKRCTNPKTPGFENYGGRGIVICPEWDQFEAFRDWALANGYADDLSIERKDVNGNYEPTNCTWANAAVQSANRRYTYKAPDGELWWHKAKANGISWIAFNQRRNAGWPMEQAVSWPMGVRREKRARGPNGRFA